MIINYKHNSNFSSAYSQFANLVNQFLKEYGSYISLKDYQVGNNKVLVNVTGFLSGTLTLDNTNIKVNLTLGTLAKIYSDKIENGIKSALQNYFPRGNFL